MIRKLLLGAAAALAIGAPGAWAQNTGAGAATPAAVNGAVASNGAGGYSQAAASGLSNGVSGSGAVVLQTAPTVTTIAGKNALSSITAGATAQIGTGGTAVCAASHVCTSLSGEVTLTTGTGTLAAGTLFTLNFADTRTNLANCLVVQNTGGTGTQIQKLLWTPTSTTLVFATGATPAASTTYIFDYECGGN